jgi:hypothetical protein
MVFWQSTTQERPKRACKALYFLFSHAFNSSFNLRLTFLLGGKRSNPEVSESILTALKELSDGIIKAFPLIKEASKPAAGSICHYRSISCFEWPQMGRGALGCGLGPFSCCTGYWRCILS